MKNLAAALLLAFFVPAIQENSKLLHTAEVVPGKLSVSVYSHEIETRDGMLRCWTYVSQGTERHGQREIVFTLRRTPEMELRGFPRELFDIFELIHGYAEKGELVSDGGYTVFNPGMRFLGRKGPWGLMYLPAGFPGPSSRPTP